MSKLRVRKASAKDWHGAQIGVRMISLRRDASDSDRCYMQ